MAAFPVCIASRSLVYLAVSIVELLSTYLDAIVSGNLWVNNLFCHAALKVMSAITVQLALFIVERSSLRLVRYRKPALFTLLFVQPLVSARL